jgi:hypothetical protein
MVFPKMLLRVLLIFLTTFFLAPLANAQWSIVSVSSTQMEEQTSDVSIDFWLHITIKNVSNKTLYIWGQNGFYLVESFIKKGKNQIWERRNTEICGTTGEPTWQEVRAGEEIKLRRRQSLKDVGDSMMLTFQTSNRPDGIRQNSEVLLGSFEIPKPKS